jgi:[ribosomal protein S5]-alanine N-acetyltransferase
MFLYESISSENLINLRLGYLLSESVWGAGLGSELIQGLVAWSEDNPHVNSISGGVEINNIGSINVLEKNGFSIIESNDQPENMVFLERRTLRQ